jgi:hypothetical protein
VGPIAPFSRTYNWAVIRRLIALTFLAAFVVFCVVQDRVTAAGASRYAVAALAALDRHQPVAPIDSVMGPAVRRSVGLGLASAGVVLVAGLGTAAVVARSRRG